MRIENITEVGTPDVNYCVKGCEGWIELKHVAAVPLRETTPVKIGLTVEQRNWIIEREVQGGRTFILAQIERELFLFGGGSVYSLWAGAPFKTLHAFSRWKLTDGWERFLDEITK